MLNGLISSLADISETDYDRWVEVLSTFINKQVNYDYALKYVINNDSTLRTLPESDRTIVIQFIEDKLEQLKMLPIIEVPHPT